MDGISNNWFATKYDTDILGISRNPPEDRDQELIDKNIILLNKKFEIFDKFLEDREYILNNKFGMSDIIMGAASIDTFLYLLNAQIF